MDVCARQRGGARCAVVDNDDNRIIFESKCVRFGAMEGSFDVHQYL